MPERMRLEQVDFHWPGSDRALAEISGTIQEGVWLAVIGPNGAGKTTLLRLLAGLEQPKHGQILVGGQSLSAYSSRERSTLIALMPQAIGPLFDLKVHTVVEMGRIGRYRFWDHLMRLQPSHRHAVEEALWATDTLDLADRNFTELSGGESRRVLLAMVLAQETPILLLDEPTVYLDPGHASDLLNRVESLVREQKKTVVMAYHDLSTVALYCDEIWAMDRGRVVLSGTASEVVLDPRMKELYALDFLSLTHPTRQRPVLLLP
jgi:iron complex transport system ATP-binding protein